MDNPDLLGLAGPFAQADQSALDQVRSDEGLREKGGARSRDDGILATAPDRGPRWTRRRCGTDDGVRGADGRKAGGAMELDRYRGHNGDFVRVWVAR